MRNHVLSVSPCKSCQERAEPKEWEWNRCATPSEADARLIAAAPDMLDALIQIRAVRAVRSELASGHIQHVIDILDSIVALADSAISKAEGRDA